MNGSPVKVLIVDDSALVRAVLQEVLNADPRLRVVGSAADPYEARELIKRLHPDVLTLDIEMPRMNGIAFLKNLMRLRPLPVVMISTLTQQGAPQTLEALELGAVDFVAKPINDDAGSLDRYSAEIVEKVYAAASANIASQPYSSTIDRARPLRLTVAEYKTLKPDFVCVVGASTGGTEAIKELVVRLPENSPPILVAQHIPAEFSASFARRLDGLSAVKVVEASDGEPVQPGSVYIAPGHSHLRLDRSTHGLVCRLGRDAEINRHRPSVEALFDSLVTVTAQANKLNLATNTSANIGANAIAVLLTGMGKDGAEALLRLHRAGVVTVVQDESSSVVWGMPGAAVKLGAASKVLALDKISRYILAEAFF